ncbi:thermonuclease family protein, partial [Aquibium sp. A9E412]|uniref:thermonuclease family protein n=1 Tax=Aquibium sp. A9E412 TaxID=2976767 RepID=UPI0025AFE29A
ATAAGRLEAEGLTVLLSGLQVVEPDRLCDAADGGTWPCGMRARTAFRGLLRGRAVACDLDDGAAGGAGTVTARCALAGRDLGRWLVEHGWALAAPGGPYGQAAAAARAERRGLFGGGRR